MQWMMNKGKNSKPYGEKMQSNLENHKFFKPNQEVYTFQWFEIIKAKMLFRDSKLQTNQDYWNKKIMM